MRSSVHKRGLRLLVGSLAIVVLAQTAAIPVMAADPEVGDRAEAPVETPVEATPTPPDTELPTEAPAVSPSPEPVETPAPVPSDAAPEAPAPTTESPSPEPSEPTDATPSSAPTSPAVRSVAPATTTDAVEDHQVVVTVPTTRPADGEPDVVTVSVSPPTAGLVSLRSSFSDRTASIAAGEVATFEFEPSDSGRYVLAYFWPAGVGAAASSDSMIVKGRGPSRAVRAQWE